MDANKNMTTSQNPDSAQAPIPSFATLPHGYLANGYTGPTINYVTNWAEDIAEKLAPMEPETFRKMYYLVERIPRGDYKAQRTAICKLETMANNLVRKGKAPEVLIDFCKANIAVTTDIESIKAFISHMEAIYSYMAVAGAGGEENE